jgi:phasin family protein
MQIKGSNNMDNVMKTTGSMTSFSQGNIEAIFQSSQIWAAGCQAIAQAMAATTQAQIEHTVSTWKALSGVKSLKEAMDLQTGLARAAFEKASADTTKLTDATIKLTEQTMAPLTARLTLAAEKFAPTQN